MHVMCISGNLGTILSWPSHLTFSKAQFFSLYNEGKGDFRVVTVTESVQKPTHQFLQWDAWLEKKMIIL